MPFAEWKPDVLYGGPAGGAMDGAGKYYGAIATGYDAKREQSPKWVAEQLVITDMLRDKWAETRLLDCPVGTGRFLPFYRERKFEVVAMDLSTDMLAEARKKSEGMSIEFVQGDVRDTMLPDKCVDVAVMCRLTRWLSPEDCQKAIRELQRVTRSRIIFTARVRNHPHARPLELFEAALDGWHVARNEAGYHEDYRIICLERDVPTNKDLPKDYQAALEPLPGGVTFYGGPPGGEMKPPPQVATAETLPATMTFGTEVLSVTPL